MEEDDATARAEFIRPAVVFAPVIDRASLLPDLAEPTEEDVRAYEKKQKPKK